MVVELEVQVQVLGMIGQSYSVVEKRFAVEVVVVSSFLGIKPRLIEKDLFKCLSISNGASRIDTVGSLLSTSIDASIDTRTRNGLTPELGGRGLLRGISGGW